MTATEIMALIEAAETVFNAASKAINDSNALSDADRQALIGRIKTAQAAVPEWD